MKTNMLKLTAIMLLLTGGFCSCEKNDVSALKGTKWKLIGIVDAETGVLQELEPQDCAECYMLVFDTDNNIVKAHIMNDDILNLNLQNLTPAYIPDRLYPEFYPIYGEYYSDCMIFRAYIIGTEAYAATSKELKLYYVDSNTNKYILFKPF
jgi:hypothetical protein